MYPCIYTYICMYVFHLFNKYLLSTHYVPSVLNLPKFKINFTKLWRKLENVLTRDWKQAACRPHLAHTGLFFSHISLNPYGPYHSLTSSLQALHASVCSACPWRYLYLQYSPHLRPLISQARKPMGTDGITGFPKFSQQQRWDRNSHALTPNLPIKGGGRAILSP